MGKTGVLCLILMTIPYGRAQLLSSPFDRQAGIPWGAVAAENFAFGRSAMDRPSGQVISATRLSHKPPRQARIFFALGMRDAGKNFWSKAAREFGQAVSVDPEFSEAYANLGVEDCRLGYLEESASALRHAIELDAATSTHHSNLAFVLMRLGRPAEAEREAQTAVDLDAANSRGQLMLGFLLASRPATHRQAAVHLTEAAREFPEAHAVLSDMYRSEGDSRTAASELDQYRETISNRGSH